MKTKILWIFIIIFTMIAVNSCSLQKKLNKIQFSQKDSQDDIQNKEFTPYISMAAVKEGATTCYRDGSNLMCKNGTNVPITIAENIHGQFMLFNQNVYYFTHNLDLHKVDINSWQDTLMIYDINASLLYRRREVTHMTEFQIISIFLSAAGLVISAGRFIVALLAYLNDRKNKHK